MSAAAYGRTSPYCSGEVYSTTSTLVFGDHTESLNAGGAWSQPPPSSGAPVRSCLLGNSPIPSL